MYEISITLASVLQEEVSWQALLPADLLWSPTGIRGARVGNDNGAYDLHPDGKRLAVAAAEDQRSVVQDKVVFVFNFFDYLRTIAPRR